MTSGVLATGGTSSRRQAVEKLALIQPSAYLSGMGFHFPESCLADPEASDRSTWANPDPYPKNRVWGFRDSPGTRTRRFPSQPLELQRETATTTLGTTSGLVDWLSNDPIGISGGLNQYVFCANNPVNFTDPDGLIAEAIALPWLGTGSAAGSGVFAGLGPAAAIVGAGYAGVAAGHWLDETFGVSDWIAVTVIGAMELHSKNARPSTKHNHEQGEARTARDQGGEKADINRRWPSKRPPKHKGPWPPKGNKLVPFLPDNQNDSCGEGPDK